MKYDIFISYRRDGGEQSAKSIYDRLKEKGYNVFLDVETLRSGAFNEKLYSVIEECSDFLVILSPNSLDRCINEGDWVRLEIAHAIKCGKNIVPIMLRDFSFPHQLPQDIDSLRYQNGIQASVEFFDAFLEKLYTFLKCKPGFIRRFVNSLSWRRSAIAVIAFILLMSGIWGGSVLLKQNTLEKGTYPVSKRQINDVKNMLHYVQMNLTVLDTMCFTYQNALKDCEDHLLNPTASSYQNVMSRLSNAKETLKKQSKQAVQLSSDLSSAISETSLNISDLTALSQMPDALLAHYTDSLDFLEFSMDPDKPFDNAGRHRIVAINKELMKLDAESIFLGTCELLLPVHESALKDLRTEFLPSLSIVSQYMQLWSRDETEIKSQEKNIETQQNNLMMEYATLTGEMNKYVISEKEALVDLLIESGMSKEEAQSYVDKSLGDAQSLDNKKKELDALKKELENQKQLLRGKIAPKESDDPYLVWGKALRFLTVKMYDDAINTFQFYLNMVRDTDSDAAVYVPSAINFVKNISVTGIDYGLLVTGYEPGKPKNPYYKMGDIIIAVNKTVCRNFEDYKNIKETIPQDSEFTVTVMRPDGSGVFKTIDIVIPPGQSKVALMNLKESEE